MRIRVRSAMAIAMAGAITLSLASGASADPGNEKGRADTAAALIAKVAPHQGHVVIGKPNAGNVTSDQRNLHIAVPTGRDRSVTFASTDPKQSLVGLEVNLPTEVVATKVTVAKDGTVVYEPSGGGASAAVQILDNGAVRLQTITPDARGPREFTYTFGGNVRPVEGADGAIDLVADYGTVAVTVGSIGSAWAADATGAPVASHYRIVGNSLVQVIEPSAAAVYPIVADPATYYAWWGDIVFFNRAETHRIAVSSDVATLLGALIPEPVLSKAAAAMAGMAAIYAHNVYDSGACIKFTYYLYTANIWGSYRGSYCR